jgi:uncharacterized membrane protein YccC
MAAGPETQTPALPWYVAFWRILKRLDKSKINSVRMSVRNALAVGIPLAIGIELGHPLGGVAVATGALNVAFSDGADPYPQRARRMLAWSFLGALAVFLGSITGKYHHLAILVASAWAMAAGLLVSISPRAGDLGLNTLVTLIVYAARGALSPVGALQAGLLVLSGGLLQTAFALGAWPIRRYRPERMAIGRTFQELAAHASQHPDTLLTVPLIQASPEVQDTLSALGRDHSLEGERFRLLFDQADRLRFSIYSMGALRPALEARQQSAIELLDETLELSCQVLRSVGESLLADDCPDISPELVQRLRQLTENAQHLKTADDSSPVSGLAAAMDVVAGQLRLVMTLTDSTTPAGEERFAERELAPPWKLQMRSWLATLTANLTLKSSAFRHAIRLAVCVAIGDAIGRSINTERHYWLAMTVAVVLKPDFASTISRGVLRLCGTFAGLLVATALFHFLPPSALTQLFLVSAFTFLMRFVGGANYGVFSVAISGLIVFLIAETGVAPAAVVAQRAINTAAGGLFALVAYAAWPTWERTQVTDVVADMIDRSRDYFRLVMNRLSDDSDETLRSLNRVREAWREDRSKAEASIDRLLSEPGSSQVKLDLLTSILASSHALARSIMGLEAGMAYSMPRPAPPALEKFAHDVEFTLYFISEALRGSSAAAEALPSLREDHRGLLESQRHAEGIEEFVITETDRLTVSLNTLREQAVRYVAMRRMSLLEADHTTIK